jgi:hypothetical protein
MSAFIISITCGKHLHGTEAWANNTRLNPPHLIEVSVQNQESERVRGMIHTNT